MKFWFLVLPVVLLSVSFAGFGRSETRLPVDGKIITAIDIAELLRKGVDMAEIAGRISRQNGFDRGSINNGETDISIINNFISMKNNAIEWVDLQKSIKHKANADRYFNEALYNNAASEYTVAIQCSRNNHDLYLRRGNANKRYLMDYMSIEFKSYSGKVNRTAKDNATNFLCNAIISDYSKAAELNDEAITSDNQELYLLKYNMKNDKQYPRFDRSVIPYYGKAAQNTADMVQLRRLYQNQRILNQAKFNIDEAIAESKMVCEGKYPTKPF